MFDRKRRLFLSVLVSSILVALMGAAGAGAATITPNTFADDQVINGNCTLREAVTAANNNAPADACPAGSGNDLINLAAGTYDLAGATDEDANAGGDLDIFADEDPETLTIQGAGARDTVVRSTVADRVFDVTDGDVTLTISGVTITGGSGVTQGGGIFANGPLVATDVTVTGNTADSQGGTFGGQGGGIFSNSALTLTGATLNGNHALSTGADFPGQGGGLFVNDEPTIVTNTTVTENDTNAGAVFPGQGGGIFLNDVSTLVGVTVSHNQADPSGDGEGGGIFYNDQLTARGVLVSDNLVGNTPSECFDNDDLISEGGNLERGADCGFTHPSDQSGVDPLLGPLQDNGGPTNTRALPAGSPAVDAWPTENGCPATDQRGVARPQFAACDSGAFEREEARPVGPCGTIDVPVTINGTDGDDEITGTPGRDVIAGGPGRDRIRGLGGNDVICGHEGKDRISGGEGEDTLRGGKNADRVGGGKGKDKVRGQTGKDKLKGGKGRDRLVANKGKDRLGGGKGNDKLKGGNGNDKLNGGKGKDKLNGGRGEDRCNDGPGPGSEKKCE